MKNDPKIGRVQPITPFDTKRLIQFSKEAGWKSKLPWRQGQNGTKQLLKEYGDQLVCVRYRYDKARQKRLKTIELIVDVQDWIPGVIIPVDRKVPLKIGFGEADLRDKAKSAGGYWNPDQKAWMLSYRQVLHLGLERRVIDPVVDL